MRLAGRGDMVGMWILVLAVVCGVLAGFRPGTLWRRIFWGAGIAAGVALPLILLDEVRTSRFQARLFSRLAAEMAFRPADGPSPAVLQAPAGPYDRRLGYTLLADLSVRLQAVHFEIDRQARASERLQALVRKHLFPPYREKVQAGLTIVDRHGHPFLSQQYPQRIFTSFEEIPPLVVGMLLFLENRELLDAGRPLLNPAVEWDRLALSLIEKGIQLFEPGHPVPGGSTLATQIEKFRHSPQGITASVREKLRQMISASLRAYRDGPETLAARRHIVLDYLNSLPLAARNGHGEVNSLGDGLWVWYGIEFQEAMDLLRGIPAPETPERWAAKARALKAVLSLLVAHKRPTEFFRNPEMLHERCDRHLRLLAANGIIPRELAGAALDLKLELRSPSASPPASPEARAAVKAVKSRLLPLLGIDRFYDLDRMDLTVASTLDLPVQSAIIRALARLTEPDWLRGQGLWGPRLLGKGDPAGVVYSFILYERTPQGNLLRVQADTLDQPLNINEGIKMDLGSTAKLRTLVHYLEIVAELHDAWHELEPAALADLQTAAGDRLTRWALSYLIANPDRELKPMLEAAMARVYSASPREKFFTGGGLHTFENFNPEDDVKSVSVREALVRSVNLVFVRLMRDMVHYHMFREPGSAASLLKHSDHPDRQQYLRRFADYEGGQFVRRFYHLYKSLDPEAALKRLLQPVKPVPDRLSAVFRSVYPQAGPETFGRFLREQLPGSRLSDPTLEALYAKYDPARLPLEDRGYIARVHPLELWVVSHLQTHPGANLAEVLEASVPVRQAIYSWLFRTSRKHRQDVRIRTLLETEAFMEIHRAWKRLGYPFPSLVASYATALGSSADRPAALAELMGILVNDGVYLPGYRIEGLHFAADTPYEVCYRRERPPGIQVLKPEIAQVVKETLFQVVAQGTAQRARHALRQADGTEIQVGGKTGTGDHRYKVFGPGGTLTASRVVSRTATFAFIVGDRFFGTLTAVVQGEDAGHYDFTSTLPVALFRTLAPLWQPLLEDPLGQAGDKFL